MKHKSHDLLFKAFSMLDISLLRRAVKKEEELNVVYDNENYGPFWLNDAFSRFLLNPEGTGRLSAVKETWNEEKKKIKVFLKEAVHLGMDANMIYDEHDGGYLRTLSLAMYIPEDLEFIDFLISLGFDPRLAYGGGCTALEELEAAIDPNYTEEIEYQIWLKKLYDHLPKRLGGHAV